MWRDKVCNFLYMMDIQDSHSPPPMSSTLSSSSISTSHLHPFAISSESWKIGEKTTQHILSLVQPSADSEKRRKEIIEYVQTLVEKSCGIKVYPFGSVPLKTYLPHGDVDLTVVSHYDTNQDLAAEICNLLQDEEKNNTTIQVKDVLYVPAQVKVVKSIIGNISVDISFNQTAGLSALCFLEQVDRFIGKDHLFKRSVILIKAWCYYESRLLGGYYGLISTYALETMVLHVINHFHSSLHCSLSVLYKFLKYYSEFDWETYCVGINGLVLMSSLPVIEVQRPHDSDEALLSEDFLKRCRKALSCYTGVFGIRQHGFPVKFLNIMDPLRDDNNLGRSVSKGNFYRIRSALSYGCQKLGDFLALPSEKITEGLEKFFVNTLERNGRGNRADVLDTVPLYGEMSTSNRDGDNLLAHVQYGSIWFHNHGMIYPRQSDQLTPWISNNGWIDTGRKFQHYDHNLYYNMDESPPSSIDSPTNVRFRNGASFGEKRKSRGTGLFIPHVDHLFPKETCSSENGNDEANSKEVERATFQDCGFGETAYADEGGEKEANDSIEDEGSCVFNFSVEEFPLLPGSKPVSINVGQTEYPKCDQVNDGSVSPDSQMEFGSSKCSSPESVLEPGKQSDSDGSVVLDPPNDPVNPVMAVEDDRESSKSEKLEITQQPLELEDEKEFPPLSRPAKPAIRLNNKKEFPTLNASMKSDKKSKRRKNFREVH